MSLLCNGKLSSKRFNKSLSDILSNILNINDENELSNLFLDSLKILRTEYQDEDFFEAVDKILNNLPNKQRRKENPVLDRVLSSFNPSMIESLKENSTVLNSISEGDSKQNTLDETVLERKERESLTDSFLDKYFPLSSDARLSFQQRFKSEIILNLFINKTGNIWTLNTSNSEMDKSIKHYQQELILEVTKYFLEYYPGVLDAFKSNLTIATKIQFIKKLFESGVLTPLSRVDLIKIPNLENSIQKNKLKGYISLITLINFDELIESTFGDAIIISYNKDYSNDVLTNKQKYTLNLGNKAAKLWRDDKKDIDETGEIGSIIQLFVESLNVWKDDTVTPQKLTFSDVKTGFGKIMNLLHNYTKGTNSQGISYNGLDLLKKNDLIQIYGEIGFNNIQNNYRTIESLISKAKLNPIMFAPILFAVLDLNRKTYFSGQPQVLNTIHSIYKNIYDYSRQNSLLSILLNSRGDNLTSDLYGFFSTLFINIENTPFTEYKETSDKGVEVVNITQNSSNRRLNNQIYSWEGMYNITIPLNFRTIDFDIPGGEFLKNESNKYIPELIVGIKNTNFRLILKGAQNGVLVQLKSISSNNSNVDLYENVNLQNLTPELYSFLSEVFGFKVDDAFVDIYKSLRGDLQVKELFDIAGTIIYNYKAGKTLNAKTKNEYQEHIKDFYDENEAKTSRNSLQPELIPNSEYVKVLNISLARDILLGYTSESTARDGEGKQLAILGLSSLMGKYMELAYNYNFGENSIIGYDDFSIYRLFNGIEFVRDYNGIEGNKLAIKFSTSEFFSGSFIYDLYDGLSLINDSGNFEPLKPDNKNLKDIFIRILGPTISDKSKLPKILLRPFDTVNVPGYGLKAVKDLTSEDIYKIQALEFGNYYAKMHNNIILEFNKINSVLAEVINPLLTGINNPELLIIPLLNYDSDFEEFNNYVKLLNISREELELKPVTSFDILHNAIYLLQSRGLENSTDIIKIIDGVSYIKDKKGFIHNNPALFHQLSIYGRPVRNFKIDPSLKFDAESLLETPEQEKTRHRLLLLLEFFANNITIRVDETSNKASAIAYDINKKIGYVKGSMIILGKIKLGTKDIESIISEKNFENWQSYQRLKEMFGEALPAELDISSPMFRLDRTLEIINNIRRLRSLTTKEAEEVILSNSSLKKKLIKFLLSKYINQGLASLALTEKIIEEDLRKKNPKWHEDTVIRKAQEFINSKSKEELSDYIAKLAINAIVELSAINSKDDLLVSEMFDLIKDLDVIKERLSLQYNIELNPEIERHNALNLWICESYNLTSVGSFIAHPGNSKSSTIFNYEESQYGLQVKRQVSLTASKHREMLNSLYGIGDMLRFFIVEDERDSVITYEGTYESGGTKPYDGATFYNMFMNVLDNNSLGADAMGLDKKPFTHAIDPKTGIGIIIKTAGFILTNDRIRISLLPGQDGRDAIMNKKMNDTIKWTQILRQNKVFDKYFNYLQKYDGTKLEIKPWYIYDPNNKSWIKRSNLRIDENGLTYWDETLCYANGEEIPNTTITKGGILVDSNYLLWKEVFGGEWSGHINSKKQLTYEHDDSSTENVLYVMNNSGIVKRTSPFANSKIKTLDNIILVLKESMVNFVVTMGASKFGASNINSTEFYNEDYNATWMECNSSDFGELLDSEHEAEGGHVSLMTQVINALGARGYSREAAQECYEALESVVLLSFEDGFDGLLHLLDGNSEPLKIFIYNLLKKVLKNVSVEDGNMLSALALGLKTIDLNSLDFEGGFAFSDPRIFNILQSKIASSIEKAVRLKIDGGQMVLNPSNRRRELIGDSISGKVSRDDLLNLQNKANWNPITISQVKFGRSYYIIDKKGNKLQLVNVDSYSDFRLLEDTIKNNQRIIEAYIDEKGNPITRDLATYECLIYSQDGEELSLWQIDVVRELQEIQNNIFLRPETIQEILWNKYKQGEILTDLENNILNEWLKSLRVPYTEENGEIVRNKDIDLKKYLRNSLQKTLDAIGNGTASTILVKGRTIVVDKSKTKVFPYEAILPMMYKTEFGLEEGDLVKDIVDDKFFFVKRDAQKIASKVPEHQYDLELKVGNGNHIYLHYSGGKKLRGVVEVNIETITENGVTYRVENGKKLYPIPPNTRIFKNITNGTEIISTDNLTEFLNYFNYNDILFGKVSEEYLGYILNQINSSTNNIALNLVTHITNIVRNRVTNHKEKLLLNDPEVSILIKIGLDEGIKNIENPENITIQDIISNLNGVLINEIFNSNLISKGHRDYEEAIKLLIDIISNDTFDKQIKLEKLLKEYPLIKNIVEKGLIKHTSFLTSLETVVSRTPAQSHLSFMAMKVVAFCLGIENSIYVNRMLLFLQGSDYDIDKANVLGLKFHNGELITWSYFYDLSSRESAEISEQFPFPTGKNIGVGQMTSRAFDVNEKNYDTLIDNDSLIIVRDSAGNVLSAIKNIDENGTEYWIISGDLSYTSIRAILHKIPQGNHVYFANEDLLDNKGLGIKDNINTKDYDYEDDFLQYLQSLNVDEDGNYTLQSLVQLIRTCNNLKYIDPEFKREINLVNKHNLYLNKNPFKRKYALYNFISIKTKNVSKNPINLIQGQTGIDKTTDEFKSAVAPGSEFDRLSAIPTSSDASTVMARIRSLILTLSGKQNTGIVASAMKTFEAMSLYYYNILALGSTEEQRDLLANIRINGKSFKLLANSYVKNTDSIKNEEVYDALKEVNNLEDAFILMSALLSLSTDNAKDPTLSKYNASPEMIGTYLAGIIMGVDMDVLRDLIISDTGILLSNILKGNIFDSELRKFNRLSLAISFLKNPPVFYFNEDNKDVSDLLLKLFKLYKIPTEKDNKLSPNDIQKALRNKNLRLRIRQLAVILLNPSIEKISKTDEEIISKQIKDIESDPNYWTWKEGSKKRLELQKLQSAEQLSKPEQKTLKELEAELKLFGELDTLLEGYKQLQQGIPNETARLDLEGIKQLYDSIDDDSIKKLKDLVFDKKNKLFKDWLKSIFEWTDYKEIIERDFVEGDSKYSYDEARHNRLSEIDKLNRVNEEMGELRKVLALNLGLPNLVLDLLNWIRGFRSILREAVTRKGLDEENESLVTLAQLNLTLREQGKIDFVDDLYIDLNQFLMNDEYLKAVINAYSSAKQFVNIMSVMINVPHYRGYLKAMNLLYEGSKAASVVYRELARLSDWILPKLNIYDSTKLQQFLKTATSIIFRKINNNFLRSQQETFRIPLFSIVNGELIEEHNEDGSVKYRSITLGSDSDNKIFSDWVVNYLYPYLKQHYPENPFVKAITLRTYKFNADHNLSVNVAKSLSYNMKNPLENVTFNEIKQGLLELNLVKLDNGENAGIVTALFYYNLIAYNGLPGSLALTDLFEDLVVYNQNTHVTDYTNYLREVDKSDKPIFSDNDEELLLRLLAPTVSGFENVSLYPYAYLINPETNKYELVHPIKKERNEYLEDDYDDQQQDIEDYLASEYGYDDSEEGSVKTRRNITWSDLKKDLGVTEDKVNTNINSNGSVVFRGFEINFDIYSLIENSNNPILEIIRNSNSIILTINGLQKTLDLFITDSKKLGWTKEECLDIFLFRIKKRADGTRYNQLDLDILRHGLKSRSEQKSDCYG